MENLERYNHLNTYFKKIYGERVLKICIDGGFTCPNRDGKCGKGGCIFCGERGSGEHLNTANSITEQVKHHLDSYRGKRANKFIAYFQNFSNTYADITTLKQRYDSALIDERIVGLSIATRPDCINNEIGLLLASYHNKYSVTVELGLQTSSDVTAKLINRGYESYKFTNAVSMLRAHGIDVVVHIMIGLPNESINDLANTINFINKHDIQGIKLHSTYVIKGTKLEKMYRNNEYIPLTIDTYIDSLVFAVTHLRNDIIIHRLSGDAPKDLLVAPAWNTHKKVVLNTFEKIMRERNLYQGMYDK